MTIQPATTGLCPKVGHDASTAGVILLLSPGTGIAPEELGEAMMATIRAFGGKKPEIADDVFVAETAVIVGDVSIGAGSSIWYGTVLRGDVYNIRIGSGVNIQDNSVVHVTAGKHATIIGDNVTIGHSVVLHGCTVANNCIIGMGAIVMDQAEIGENCIVGAGALVTPGTKIPAGSLVLGSPGRPRRELTADEIEWTQSSADHYVRVSRQYLEGQDAPA